jgi:hypothetical protein
VSAPPDELNPLAEAAAGYLRRGLKVIALTGKTPNVKVHKHGLYDHLAGAPESPNDWALIYSVFTHPDTTGVGILTEWPIIVVDIDGEEGAQQWRELVGAGNETDGARWIAKTGRGLHLYYQSMLKTGTIKLASKLDLKADGGYVAAPPSRHPDGHLYEWLLAPGDDPLFEAPDPVMEAIEDRLADLRMLGQSKTIRRQAWGPRYREGDHVFYAQPGHDSLIEGMSKAGEGNRNAYLHWAASTLAEEGGSDDEFEQLAEAALAVGLEREETRRTVRSARKAHG